MILQAKNNRKKYRRENKIKKTKIWYGYRKGKKKHNELFSYYFNYSSPSNILSRLSNARGEINEEQVYSINKTLSKIKNIFKNVPKDDPLKTEENEKIIDIVERILELNSENQLGLGLNILTPNQMLSRLPISLAQFKAGNNSEKLKNKIRQLLYSSYRSKKLTKQLYKSLVDII